MEDLENETYLSLEGMTPKEAVLHTIAVMYGTMTNSPIYLRRDI